MTTAYPTALDNFSNPTPEQLLSEGSRTHSQQHSDLNDAIEAIEARIGISELPTAGVMRSLQKKVLENFFVEDFGAVGDGVANDTAAVQAALDYIESIGGGKLSFGHSQTYKLGTVDFGSNLHIDFNYSTLSSITTLGDASMLRTKYLGTGAVDATVVNNVLIENGFLDCNVAADRAGDIMGLAKAGNVTLRNLRFRNSRYMGLALAGCKRVHIENCELSGMGKVAVTAEGGPAIWIGAYSFDGSVSEDIFVEGNYIHDCEWAAMYAIGKRLTIRANRINAVKESAIFSNSTADGFNVIGNYIRNITRKYISGSGIETGAKNTQIIGNYIDTVANCGISMLDVQGAMISGNIIRNVKRESAYAGYVYAGGIEVTSLTAAPNQPRDITIVGNSVYDASSPSTQGIRVGGSGAGGVPVNIQISGNNLAGTAWTSGRGVYIDPVYWTPASCYFGGNIGANDAPRHVTATRVTDFGITTATPTAVIFTAALNNDEATWTAGSPTRITVPRTVRKVRFTGAAAFAANATGYRSLRIYKNGAVLQFGGFTRVASLGAGATTDVGVTTPWLDVTAGDYFELFAEQTSGGNLSMLGASPSMMLAMEMA